MSKVPPRPPRLIWVGLLLFFGVFILAYFAWFLQASQNLSQRPMPVLGTIADFTLTNQEGQPTTLAALTNHVWLADIIFTRCGGPCPRMTAQMKSVEDALPKDSTAKLVTLTTDPDFDSPPVLKRYGERFGADFSRWTFLTGTKSSPPGVSSDVREVAAYNLKLGAVPVKPEEQKNAADLFVHTTVFVAVDKHAQLRGIFETGGDGVDWTNDVEPRLMKSISQLENEP